MIITVNVKGQITNIDDNILVANSTYGSAVIQVRLEGAPKETVNSVTLASLSVIRADGLAINDLYMSVKQESGVGVYTSALSEDSGVFEVAGTIQISIQLKLSTGKIYSTITCTGFVQQNIGTLSKTEANDVETRIYNKYIEPLTENLADKVDKLDANATYDLLYVQPSLKDDTDNSASRKVLKDGEALPHGILGTDGDGKYHVPRGADDNSPVTVGQLAETASQKVDKSSIGQPDGVAGLNNEGYVPLGQLPPVYRDIAVEFDKKVDKESIGQPDGVAGLDSGGKVPMAQLPDIVGEIPDKVDKSVIGKAGGVAGLDATGKVPSANLPSYVDDVINAYVRPEGTLYGADWLSLTEDGEALTPEDGKVYIVVKGEYVNREYRWSGELYAQIKGDIVIGEVTGTAYDGGKGHDTAIDLATLTARFNYYIKQKITESQLDSNLTEKVNNNAKLDKENQFNGVNLFYNAVDFKNDGYLNRFRGDVQFDAKVTGFDEVAISTVEPTGVNTKEWVNPDEDILVSTLTLTGETGEDTDKVMHQQGVTKALSTVADNASSEATKAYTHATEALTAAKAAQTTANSGVTKAEAAQTTANSGVTKAEAAQTKADAAMTKATNAQTAADEAKNKKLYRHKIGILTGFVKATPTYEFDVYIEYTSQSATPITSFAELPDNIREGCPLYCTAPNSPVQSAGYLIPITFRVDSDGVAYCGGYVGDSVAKLAYNIISSYSTTGKASKVEFSSDTVTEI